MDRDALHFDAALSGDRPDSAASPRSLHEPILDPMQTSFETDLAAWLTWLDVAHASSEEARSLRRLESVYVAGWIAVTVATLAIVPLGLAAATLTVVLIAATLFLGCLVTAPGTRLPPAMDDQAAEPYTWSSGLGTGERAQLVRIINLCRVVTDRRGQAMLLTELDEVLAGGHLASCTPLFELRDLLLCESSRLIPFGSERESEVLESLC